MELNLFVKPTSAQHQQSSEKYNALNQVSIEPFDDYIGLWKGQMLQETGRFKAKDMTNNISNKWGISYLLPYV